MTKLSIGAYDTSAYDSSAYEAPVTNAANDVTAYLDASSEAYDTKTVFEVTDEFGRVKRFKNTKEWVRIEGAPEYAFRKAPSFMSVLDTEVRSAWRAAILSVVVSHAIEDLTYPFFSFRLMHAMHTTKPRKLLTTTFVIPTPRHLLLSG